MPLRRDHRNGESQQAENHAFYLAHDLEAIADGGERTPRAVQPLLRSLRSERAPPAIIINIIATLPFAVDEGRGV